MKLDLERAYDRIEWKIIIKIFRGETWCKFIYTFMSTTHLYCYSHQWEALHKTLGLNLIGESDKVTPSPSISFSFVLKSSLT